MFLMALGMGATFVSVTIAATSGVPHHESGLASGILNTAQQVGGSLGLAILTGVATSATASYIKDLGHAPSTHDVAAASVHGFHDGFLIATAFAIMASLISLFVIQQQKAKTDPSHGEPVIVAGH
jgi:sugar phosphate permease